MEVPTEPRAGRSALRVALPGLLLLLVLSILGGLPVGPGPGLAYAASSTRHDVPGFRNFHWRAPSVRRGLHAAPEWIFVLRRHTLDLQDEEELIQRLEAIVQAREDRPLPEFVPLLAVDEAAGEVCEWALDDSGEETQPQRLGAEGESVPAVDTVLELRPLTAGFGHLGSPAVCGLVQGPEGRLPGEILRAEVVVRRPRTSRMEERFALFLPAQGPEAPSLEVNLAVEAYADLDVVIEPTLWKPQLRQKALPGKRIRRSVAAEWVTPLPSPPGCLSVAGRVPGFWVRSGADWDAVSLEHRAWYDAATVLDDTLIPLAGRVLGSADLLASVREAARIALDNVDLDPSEGRGGTWLLPRRAASVAADGRGTAADRAALLVALLRGAEIRAEVVLASSAPLAVSPAGSPRPLNRVLVLVPELSRPDGNGPLFVDPSLPSDRLFARDPALLGRPALLLGPTGARWLRISDVPDRRRWTLNVRETQPDSFELRLEGALAGQPAAEALQWAKAGTVPRDAPVPELAWFAVWGDSLQWTVKPTEAGAHVEAHGKLAREQLAPPMIPKPAPRVQNAPSWPFPRDTQPLDLELLESWSFRAAGPGGPAPPEERSTPFWTVSSLGRWTGPVFNRRSRIRWTATAVSVDASVEVERFLDFVDRVYGSVKAP